MDDIELKGKGLLTKLKLISLKYWNSFLIDLPDYLLALFILALGFFLAFKVSRRITSRLTTKVEDRLLINFIDKAVRLALIVLTIMLSLNAMGFKGIAGGLLAGAGISAFIIGFAFKDIAENFLAGIILAFNRPFQINDAVAIKEYSGKVVALDLRVTHIKTFDGKDVFIPNSTVLKDVLTNLTRDGFIRMDFVVGIDYSNDIETATQLIYDSLMQIDEVDKTETPFTTVEELGVNTVNLRVYFWTMTDDYKKGALLLKSKIIKTVKNLLMEKGFNLPANIQELKLHQDQDAIPLKIIKNEEEK